MTHHEGAADRAIPRAGRAVQDPASSCCGSCSSARRAPRPSLLPAPSLIGEALWQFRGPCRSTPSHTAWMTLAASPIAVSCSASLPRHAGWAPSRLIHAGSYPLLVGFNAIPKVAVVPILVIWFGVGWESAGADRLPDLVLPPSWSTSPRGSPRSSPRPRTCCARSAPRKRDIIVKVGIPPRECPTSSAR